MSWLPHYGSCRAGSEFLLQLPTGQEYHSIPLKHAKLRGRQPVLESLESSQVMVEFEISNEVRSQIETFILSRQASLGFSAALGTCRSSSEHPNVSNTSKRQPDEVVEPNKPVTPLTPWTAFEGDGPEFADELKLVLPDNQGGVVLWRPEIVHQNGRTRFYATVVGTDESRLALEMTHGMKGVLLIYPDDVAGGRIERSRRLEPVQNVSASIAKSAGPYRFQRFIIQFSPADTAFLLTQRPDLVCKLPTPLEARLKNHGLPTTFSLPKGRVDLSHAEVQVSHGDPKISELPQALPESVILCSGYSPFFLMPRCDKQGQERVKQLAEFYGRHRYLKAEDALQNGWTIEPTLDGQRVKWFPPDAYGTPGWPLESSDFDWYSANSSTLPPALQAKQAKQPTNPKENT